jgi:hypothetical protein
VSGREVISDGLLDLREEIWVESQLNRLIASGPSALTWKLRLASNRAASRLTGRWLVPEKAVKRR